MAEESAAMEAEMAATRVCEPNGALGESAKADNLQAATVSEQKKIDDWVSQKEAEWHVLDGKLRKKYPTRAAFDRWLGEPPSCPALRDALITVMVSRSAITSDRSFNKKSFAERQKSRALARARRPASPRKVGRTLDPRKPFVQDNAGWAHGLAPVKQREWLVDCYRMRADDDFCVRGELTGMYAEDANRVDVLRCFLLFCKVCTTTLVPWPFHALFLWTIVIRGSDRWRDF